MNMNTLKKYCLAALVIIPFISFLHYQQLCAEAEASQKFVDDINAEIDRRDAELQPLIKSNAALNAKQTSAESILEP
jgi:hypothetical protein